MIEPTMHNSLVRYLQEELAVPAASIDMAVRHGEHPSLLPMVLWKYGLITIDELDQVFDWMEAA